MAELGHAFGMPVLASFPREQTVPHLSGTWKLETLLRQSDVISLHCPLTPETRQPDQRSAPVLGKGDCFSAQFEPWPARR